MTAPSMRKDKRAAADRGAGPDDLEYVMAVCDALAVAVGCP